MMLFSREERFKDTSENSRIHAFPGVLYRQNRVFASLDVLSSWIHHPTGSAYGYITPALHGVACIDDQVHQHLFELHCIPHAPHLPPGLNGTLVIVSYSSLHHL